MNTTKNTKSIIMSRAEELILCKKERNKYLTLFVMSTCLLFATSIGCITIISQGQ